MTMAAGLLLAACGGGSRTTSPPVAGTRAGFTHEFLAYADCMRSQGVPGYPDPRISSSGNQVHVQISPGTVSPRSPAFVSADHACHDLLPDGGVAGHGDLTAQQRAQAVTFARCVRAHGVPAFPDPDHDGVFTLPAGLTQRTPQFKRAMLACANVRPDSLSIDEIAG
jgi:hypothetical protein